MLQSEIDLLSRVASVTKSTCFFDASSVVRTPAQQAVFNRLAARGYIVFKDNRGFCLTDAALDALYRHEEQLEQDCRRKADEAANKQLDRAYAEQQAKQNRKHNWLVSIVSSILTFVLGLIAGHFVDVVSYAAGLWSSLFH